MEELRSGYKILVADDDTNVHQSLNAYFRREGYQMISAYDGKYRPRQKGLRHLTMTPYFHKYQLQPESQAFPSVAQTARYQHGSHILRRNADIYHYPFKEGAALDHSRASYCSRTCDIFHLFLYINTFSLFSDLIHDSLSCFGIAVAAVCNNKQLGFVILAQTSDMT